jgi:hypothetical protein
VPQQHKKKQNHAAGLNPVDFKTRAGALKIILNFARDRPREASRAFADEFGGLPEAPYQPNISLERLPL